MNSSLISCLNTSLVYFVVNTAVENAQFDSLNCVTIQDIKTEGTLDTTLNRVISHYPIDLQTYCFPYNCNALPIK